MFELKVEEKDVLMEALQQPWQVQEKAMETDISTLQWVEDLEQRVISADLHLKVRNQITYCVTLHFVCLTQLTTMNQDKLKCKVKSEFNSKRCEKHRKY